MPERFFRATALAGKLPFIDFHDWDDWELEKVHYRDEAEVSWLVRTDVSDRLIEEATRRWQEMTWKRKR